ncbi:hypothetical protein BT96DRAFT_997746 [Gymnopus androsaceus JB14]|uniref:DUF6534 domain-containing protein n=1 Tax=Gymnopus androsaceus JB14 TaxID=1447944 RepID=A0A6A4HCA4_9AGAR|nr:hypothetical protein BT96DRAFT_997746 [Gymnopus androsaceus JB14]
MASTGLACAAIADLLIAASLCFYLHKSHTGIRATDSVINKLLVYAINTGLLTSIFAVVDMICFLTMPHNLIHDAMNIMVGKLYTSSLLASLNVRTDLRSTLNVEPAYSMSNFNASRASRSGAGTFPANNITESNVVDIQAKYVELDPPPSMSMVNDSSQSNKAGFIV